LPISKNKTLFQPLVSQKFQSRRINSIALSMCGALNGTLDRQTTFLNPHHCFFGSHCNTNYNLNPGWDYIIIKREKMSIKEERLCP